MSWNNIIPWKVWECQNMCLVRDSEGNVIHEPECRLGKEVAERIQKEIEEYERTQNRRRNTEGSEVVGTSEGQAGTDGDEPGSNDPIKDRWGVLYRRPRS